ncbi:hypothetical protein SFRURICE_015066 [Spodoptera frugiperda]|uniref:SFRICE_000097 n=1 Tax=Spodoptera frugiperda TaxID=7108 RepID=A0A2H1V2E7_SPOFR|nr:hypothetical protein SFRURICE_015066 [Spodoptera frugiperda]
MTEDQDAKDSQSDSGSKTFINKNKDKKTKTQRPLTKIILRRLPPTMTEEAFLEQVSPIPEHDHFYFAKPDPSLGNNLYSRAYINFVNVDDIYLFRDKFDGYVFLDEKGGEYIGIVEYAPFQRIPKKKKKKDPKCGTIESDPIYQDFVESLKKDPETENQPKLEYSYPVNDSNDKKVQSTPLLEYLAARKQDKRGRDERRRRENDKRKMRIERKTKDSIKRPGDISEDENFNDNIDYYDNKYNNHSFWYGEQRIYHKSKVKCAVSKSELKSIHGSDEFISTDSDWDSHFPALSTKTHNTFTLTSGKFCDKKETQEGSQKSGGDTCFKEEETAEGEVKKIKSREWEKEKASDARDDQVKSDGKDGSVFESKSYRDRKTGVNVVSDKKKKPDSDKRDAARDDDQVDDDDMGYKKDKRENTKFSKESPREVKSKKYSDTRKERIKQTEVGKSDKQSAINKIMSSDNKVKSINHDDIKPFTQQPHVKTDDLTKIIEGMDKKVKLSDSKDSNDDSSSKSPSVGVSKMRRNSLESGEMPIKDDLVLKRQNSLDDRSKSTDREGSEEKEKSESGDRRTERRIRNKDRPSLVIYQPGMGKFSKQRLAKEKDAPPAKSINDSEKKDT